MIAAHNLLRMSTDAYLNYERSQESRHELVDGYLYAMTGASDRHEEIITNLLAAIHHHLHGSSCRVYGSNLKIRVDDDFLYPDLFVRCVQTRGDPYFKTDPVLVIEVLSPSTQRYDRGDKRLAYQSLPSLREYVLVAQDRPYVEILRRTGAVWDNQYTCTTNGAVTFASIALTINIADIYA